jgi:membrane protein implicated in regulation of membrane protease activity
MANKNSMLGKMLIVFGGCAAIAYKAMTYWELSWTLGIVGYLFLAVIVLAIWTWVEGE